MPSEEAVKPLISFIPEVEHIAYIDKSKSEERPSERLTEDQSAAIMLSHRRPSSVKTLVLIREIIFYYAFVTPMKTTYDLSWNEDRSKVALQRSNIILILNIQVENGIQQRDGFSIIELREISSLFLCTTQASQTAGPPQADLVQLNKLIQPLSEKRVFKQSLRML